MNKVILDGVVPLCLSKEGANYDIFINCSFYIYTQTIHRTTQNKQYIEQHNNLEECGPCPVLARSTLAFTLQLRKKHGKTSVRVVASKNT